MCKESMRQDTVTDSFRLARYILTQNQNILSSCIDILYDLKCTEKFDNRIVMHIKVCFIVHLNNKNILSILDCPIYNSKIPPSTPLLPK